jgi:hypothetical protein
MTSSKIYLTTFFFNYLLVLFDVSSFLVIARTLRQKTIAQNLTMAPSITKGIAPGDDSDLEDLIAKPHRSRTSVKIDSAASSPLGFSLCCGRFPDFPSARLILVVLGFSATYPTHYSIPRRPWGSWARITRPSKTTST